ncbi:hypothetical protein [Agrobacterium vaccinii]|uniref:hypothetical protein n=1 Tax=Agrobacterium vaccinii TaxID=2735528 RepID=UPI001E5E7D08|nr:hypothetical protein [Agrobacterium vaccinii]UHS55610.1 hypothetical protein HRS00_01645 [Agrobacterium vaccinii]
MGARKAKLLSFLSSHSLCYFCGNTATTIDHVPARECFLGREGPEGYEFPACKNCNNSAGPAEQTVALYRHCTDFSEDKRGAPQVHKLLDGLRNNSPSRLPIMDISVSQKRRTAQRSGITLEPGETYAGLTIIGINSGVHDDFAIFSRRLTCALFYKHFGKILPRTHMIRTQWMQFAHGKAEEIIGQITVDMPNLTRTARVNTNIGQQFTYRWYSDNSTETFVFAAQFALAFFVFGLASSKNETTSGDGWKCHEKDFPHDAAGR